MNRITQCMYGKGTVSHLMHQGSEPESRYLAFSGMHRPVVFWNITDRCNLSCEHCYSRSGPGAGGPGELSTEEALQFIDDLAAMGVPLILLTGGEPLIRHDIWDLARRARAHGIRLALSTNGTLIDAPTARRIRECGIEYAGISLDGARAATHDRFRNHFGAFDRAVAAFAHCRREGVRCGVRVTLTRKNLDELGDLVALARSLGASRFCLYWLVPSGRGRESYPLLQLNEGQVTGALDLLYRMAQETDPLMMEFLTVDAPQDAIHLIGKMEQENAPDLSAAKVLAGSLHGGCSAGTRVADIDPEGNVYPCQFARSPDFLIGNIRNTPFSLLWADHSHPVLARFRQNPRQLGGTCRDCRFRDLCGGGCRVRAYETYGDFSAEDPFCFVRNTGDVDGSPPQ